MTGRLSAADLAASREWAEHIVANSDSYSKSIVGHCETELQLHAELVRLETALKQIRDHRHGSQTDKDVAREALDRP